MFEKAVVSASNMKMKLQNYEIYILHKFAVRFRKGEDDDLVFF